MSRPPLRRTLIWLAAITAVLLLAFLIMVDEALKPGTPLSRLQQRIETARITTVLARPEVLDGIPFPAGTAITWADPSHRRVAAAHLAAPADILGVRATGLRRVMEGGWIVMLAGMHEIDGWLCANGEVELTAAGRLVDCALAGTPSWRGWNLPERTSVAPRPDLHQVWLTLPAVTAWDKPLDSPVAGKLPWITAFNDDGSPFSAQFGREAPYPVAGQELSGDVSWDYDPATYGMGRERPPLAVSGFVHEGGTRRHIVLPWPGPTTPER